MAFSEQLCKQFKPPTRIFWFGLTVTRRKGLPCRTSRKGMNRTKIDSGILALGEVARTPVGNARFVSGTPGPGSNQPLTNSIEATPTFSSRNAQKPDIDNLYLDYNLRACRGKGTVVHTTADLREETGAEIQRVCHGQKRILSQHRVALIPDRDFVVRRRLPCRRARVQSHRVPKYRPGRTTRFAQRWSMHPHQCGRPAMRHHAP